MDVDQEFEEDFEDGQEQGQQRQGQGQEKQEPTKMRSKPNFEVDIVKGDTTLSMTCSYLNNPPAEGEYGNDYYLILFFSAFLCIVEK